MITNHSTDPSPRDDKGYEEVWEDNIYYPARAERNRDNLVARLGVAASTYTRRMDAHDVKSALEVITS